MRRLPLPVDTCAELSDIDVYWSLMGQLRQKSTSLSDGRLGGSDP